MRIACLGGGPAGPYFAISMKLRGSAAWINFRRVLCERWTFENVVSLGDAAHTAHFSIGSGTKLALTYEADADGVPGDFHLAHYGGRADLVALGRPHLINPSWTLHAAAAAGYRGVRMPAAYRPGEAQLERNLSRAAAAAG